MSEGFIRHMYPGGNTPGGFFSNYRFIIDNTEARRIFVLKGGPGTGKSTFMRKIGLELAKRGYNIEFMHCSSDNNSLDGVVVPALRVAIIDGTAPHIVDPVYPGAVDEIINLGQFWNEEGFSESRSAILSISKKIKGCFTTAYRYLGAAASLKEDTEAIYHDALDKKRESSFIKDLSGSIFGVEFPITEKQGRERCMFASAITPRGFSDFLDSICNTEKIIRLSAPTGGSTRRVLEYIRDQALLRGYFVESYFCPMSPNRLEHLVIPEQGISIITANEYHDISDINNENCTTFIIHEFYDKDILESYAKQLGFNRLYIEALLQRAIESIAEAKSAHDELEKHYIKNMNFENITQYRDSLIEKILSYA